MWESHALCPVRGTYFLVDVGKPCIMPCSGDIISILIDVIYDSDFGGSLKFHILSEAFSSSNYFVGGEYITLPG